MSLLTDAYQRRDRVGLIVFQKDRATLVLHPTNSVQLAQQALADWAADSNALSRVVQALTTNAGWTPGFHSVAADARRELLERTDFMAAHMDTSANPGPVGHGELRMASDWTPPPWIGDAAGNVDQTFVNCGTTPGRTDTIVLDTVAPSPAALNAFLKLSRNSPLAVGSQHPRGCPSGR